MDAAFGEPIRPYDYWIDDKVWVPDSWFAPVPDTFALIPRNKAESFFSMENLVAPGVMCLGGPNFDAETLNTEYLHTHGFKSDIIPIIQKAACAVAHPKEKSRIETGVRNDSWSLAGLSKSIFERKLRFGGCFYEKNTWDSRHCSW